MRDLTDPRIIWLKGGLFIAVGTLASGLLIAQLPDLRYALLLAIAIWSFCRAYYFAFYVVERYVDRNYRFAGLLDFAKYAMFGNPPDHVDDEAS